MRALIPAVLCLSALPAAAQEQSRYAACLDHTAETAVEAYEEALAWETEGGGAPAEHCAAIALLRLGHEEEAATRLEALTGEPLFAAPDAAAELMRQAASAWLIAGELARAEAAATRAMETAPGSFELVMLRARVRVEAQDYAGAEADLTEALALRADNVEALVLRAHAHLGQAELTAALDDAQAAVRADPQNVDARLALGDVREAIRASSASR